MSPLPQGVRLGLAGGPGMGMIGGDLGTLREGYGSSGHSSFRRPKRMMVNRPLSDTPPPSGVTRRKPQPLPFVQSQ